MSQLSFYELPFSKKMKKKIPAKDESRERIKREWGGGRENEKERRRDREKEREDSEVKREKEKMRGKTRKRDLHFCKRADISATER